MADDLTRTASNVCIYWETPETNPQLEDAGVDGRCTATDVFTVGLITCYNDGNCNGTGTCRECRAYDVAHLQFSHKDTTHVYGTSFLLQWNSDQNKYIPVRELSPSEAGDDSAFIDTLTQYQKTVDTNFSGEQTPFNIAIYNLRARFKKCCNWQASPFMFYKSRSGTLYARDFQAITVSDSIYLAKAQDDTYPNAVSLAAACKVTAATPWKTPFTEENPTAYGCNGCKPECPYYTGPKWLYCVDSKMEMGDKISAQQVLELRFYSQDWSKFPYPEGEYRRLFKDPEIYAWTGKYEYGGDEPEATEDSQDNPMVEKIYIDDFSGASVSITKGAPEPATKGLRVYGNVPESLAEYPTLIKEIREFAAKLTITWPNDTSSSSPFVFRTFRIGQNNLRVYVDTPYIATVYAVNITTYPQGSMTDTEFIAYMLKSHPEGLNSTEGSGINTSLLYFDVELEYSPEENQVKAFTRDPTSSTGEYLTDTCFIRHKLYHAMVAQTKGQDVAGHPRIEPWIDRFEHVTCEARVLSVSNSPIVDKVIWDSEAGGKLSMYPIEEIHHHVIPNWVSIGCDKAAVTFDNVKCNAVMPWSTFEVSPRGEELYIEVDRTNNPAAASDGVVQLSLEAQSFTGGTLPGNVIIVVPKPGFAWSAGFDKKTDVITAKYYTTDYKQAPVALDDRIRLKYPNYLNAYMSELPIDLSYDEGVLTAEGSSVCITQLQNSEEQVRVYDLVDIKEDLYNRLKEEETKAIASFASGGVGDKDLKSSSEIFNEIQSSFDSKYATAFFCSDGQKVTLLEMCNRLGNLKFHEGDYTFLFIFKDETGRPIGAKRTSMLFQAAKPETRDVEIRYSWTMKLLAWPIIDSLLLLAQYNEPPAPATQFEGPETYHPKCGDHGEQFLQTHYFGDPGPMWYPYSACLSPRYHETEPNIAVKCQNYVEGFVGNDNTGSLDGKRWDYWERMRGPDMLSTHIAGTIFLVGCMYREVSYSYQLTDSQVFAGYTRIRSGHPHAPFAKDREALRVSRHFLKRNLKVRNELITDLVPNNSYEVGWADEYEQYIFTEPGNHDKGILVGDQQETPVWVHLSDGISRVNRTTPDRQHPFAHYTLESVGDYEFNEVFDYSVDNRHKLSDIMEDRDLTSTSARRPDGSLIFVPGDPVYVDEFQNYDDIVPVYKDQGIAWAWLERPKDPIREEGNQIGVNIYNPTVNVWKLDRESACFTDDGPNDLVYTPPEFDAESGALTSYPFLSWAGGPNRGFNWYTGKWLEDDPIVPGYSSIYSNFIAHPSVDLFGRGTGGNSFLAAAGSLNKYVASTTNSGTEFRDTVRGIGVDSILQVDVLPYRLSDVVQDNSNLFLEITKINEKFTSTSSSIFVADSRGYYYIESIDITWKYGAGQEQASNGELVEVRYDIPKILVYTQARNSSGVITQEGLVATSNYERSTSAELQETSGADGATYTYNGNGFKKVNYPAQSWAGVVKFDFGSLRADARANIETLEIWYRKPIAATESVMNYDQRVNISTGDTGSPDYREMLYYYSRTLVDYNDGTAYSQLEGNLESSGQLSPNLKSVKFTNRSVKDTILEYEYSDPTGTRFPYNSKAHPENSSIVAKDSDNYLHVPEALNICTKSRTLKARAHVDDNPHYVSDGGTTRINKKAVSDNENTSLCINGVGHTKLGELTQSCLYSEARSMLNGDVTTVYNWFWHPDELLFWEGTMGLQLPGKSLTLTLTSVVPELYRMYQHEHFGCTSDLSTTFSDGHLHQIPPWQALGHRLYVGNPKYNWACFDVVVFKIQHHIGESTYGTAEYGSNVSSGGTNWPYETYRDKDHYLNAGIIEVGGYTGGAIGGAGPLFWVAQSQLSHGFTDVQQETERETYEKVNGGRADSVRADASRSHFHSDEPVVGSGEQEFVT